MLDNCTAGERRLILGVAGGRGSMGAMLTVGAQLYREVAAMYHMWVDTELEAYGDIDTLTLGANQGYGMGRLKRLKVEEIDPPAGEDWPRPTEWDAGKRELWAHAEPHNDHLPGDQVRGQIEPVVRRLWKQTPDSDGKSWGPGQRREAHLLYTPGSIVEVEDWQPEIGPLGIWRMAGSGSATT